MEFRLANPIVAAFAPTGRGHDFETRRKPSALVKPSRVEVHGRENVSTLQAMRGMAAIAVAFYHTHVILSMPEYGGIDVLGSVSGFGWLGVNFFFALSGFIILFAHGKDIGKPETLKKYFWRRVARVYPIYWLFLTIFIIAAIRGAGSHDLQLGPRQLFSVYTLFPVMNAPPLPLKVAWTLMIEVKFYLVFAILLYSRRIGVAVMLLWALAIVARNCFAPAADFAEIFPDYGMLSIWNLYFLCGMLACFALAYVRNGYGMYVLAAGLLLLAWTASGAPGQEFAMRMPPLLTKFAFAFGLIIAGAVMCERHYGWKLPNWSMVLGNASYSIYLVHSMALSFVAQLNHKLAFGVLPETVVFAVAFAIAVATGVSVHYFIEKPMLRLLRERRPTKTATPAAIPAPMASHFGNAAYAPARSTRKFVLSRKAA